jgi:hypothetical protein
MCDLDLPTNLRDKLYQITTDRTRDFSRIVSYFPLSEDEKQIIASFLVDTKSSIEFHSIFSDYISEHDWEKSKDNIIKRFQEELFDID